jgi:enoyl-CoA hydratase/carnithine racemase
MSEASVAVRRDGRAGRLVLNRPKALNALDLEMIRLCKSALDAWAEDPSVHLVVIEGAGDRAFCAGGDIRAVREHAMAGETAQVEAFFAEEYALNQLIADYPKPYVALIDGICMGGGIGLSVHGDYRVATEHAMFAMPETAIGFFPDIGGTYFLPRLPGELGMYLGLTGTRVLGADAVHAGFATHFVPRERLGALSAALARDGAGALGGFATTPPPFSLAPRRAAIDRCFGAASVPALLAALQAEGGDWAEQTLGTLRGMSPSAVFWSFAAIRRGTRCGLPQALGHELALTRAITRHHEFQEGVRAMVVDKDRQPKWQPARFEDVDSEAIARLAG